MLLSPVDAYIKNNLTLKKADGLEKGSSFESYLKSMTGESLSSLEKSEKVVMQALEGKATVTDVILSLQEAELHLQTMTAVHQKGIEAYQRIMQMQV